MLIFSDFAADHGLINYIEAGVYQSLLAGVTFQSYVGIFDPAL
jgi:hypothetical protein